MLRKNGINGGGAMNAEVYLQINFIPIIALVLMRLNTERTLTYSWRSRALRFMMVLLAGIMLLNLTGRCLDGQQFAGAHVLLLLLDHGSLILLVFLSYLWYLYVCDVLNHGIGQRGLPVLKAALPLLALLVLFFGNISNGLLFYLDEKNVYHRGPIFFLYVLVVVGYLAVASVSAMRQSRREEQAERRRECRMLAWFAVPPVFGCVVQLCWEEIEFVLPATAVSLLLVYLDVQQGQVTRDVLTGLNNRGRLKQYLTELGGQDWIEKPCHLLLLDVDHFKKINDKFGHAVGDQVLKLTADQIKRTFGHTNSFLARYGGDEFLIILKGKSDDEVAAYIEALREGMAKLEWADGAGWRIGVSIGCARGDETEHHSIRELMQLADQRMYEEKNRNR